MNQEQNNLNQNNFNTQGNNGIPNNQPLNNQSFNQQPINTQPQHINNIFESGNTNNQSFNTKPPKKMNLGLIIGIVATVAVVGVGIVFGSKLLSKDDDENNSNTTETENQPSNENDKQNNSKILKASEYFDTTKFDKTKYDGLLYKDGNSYQVTDILNEELNIGYDNMLFYTFSDNSLEEEASFNFGGDTGVANSDTYIQIILDKLGHPSTYMESYGENKYGYTGSFELLYNYGDYMIVFLGYDFRNLKDYDYKYPMLSKCYITTNIDEKLDEVSRSTYTVYGEIK